MIRQKVKKVVGGSRGGPKRKGKGGVEVSAGTPTQALATSPRPSEPAFPGTFEIGTTFGLPLWSKWPAAVLKQEYRKGAWTFDLGFRQRARHDESRLFDISPLVRSGVYVKDLVPLGTPIFGGYDPAGEKRIGNALVSVAATNGGALRVITNIRLWKGRYTETATEIAMADELYRYTLLLVENVALQGAIIELIRFRAPTIPIVGYQTGMQKSHPELGLPGLGEEIKAGLWALCVDDDYGTGSPLALHEPGCECPYHVFLADLNGYPSESRTYDALMACWFARQGIRGDFAGKFIPSGAEFFDPSELLGEIPVGEFGGSFLS
jgi:hypothetical protein